MTNKVLLDTYCAAGGASYGYHLAGFEVVGVDIDPQPHYPFKFYQGDAIDFIHAYGMDFDVIAGSPPCQLYTKAQRIMKNSHPDLIDPTREAMIDTGKPYIIENVPDSPLKNPVELCGAMFGLRTYRHRLFESNVDLWVPKHPKHIAPNAKMGRRVKDGEFMHIVGNFSGVPLAREIMGIDWMVRDELKEAIPPIYTKFLGDQLMEHLDGAGN